MEVINYIHNYAIVCLHVRGDNPRALASGLSPVQVWLFYTIAHYEIVNA